MEFQNRIVAIIRGVEPKAGPEIAAALMRGGISSIEVSMSDGERSLATLTNIASAFTGTELSLGAGTVTCERELHRAMEAGARYIIMPGWDRELVMRCLDLGLPVLPGVFSPGEIMQAQAMGLRTVKLFPVTEDSMSFVKAMSGPFPAMEYVAVGGVSLQNASRFLSNGFKALGIGGSLVPRDAACGCGPEIEARAKMFVAAANGSPQSE